MEKCCMSPGRSAKRRSTIWTSLSLTRLRTSPTDSVTLWPPCRRGIVGDASNGALPSRCRRVSPRLTGNRLEPSDLAGGLPLEPVDDADVDGGPGDPHVRQLLLERAPDRIRVTGCPDHQGLGAGRGLSHLVLDDPGLPGQHRAEDVRVDDHAARVAEVVVEA